MIQTTTTHNAKNNNQRMFKNVDLWLNRLLWYLDCLHTSRADLIHLLNIKKIAYANENQHDIHDLHVEVCLFTPFFCTLEGVNLVPFYKDHS